MDTIACSGRSDDFDKGGSIRASDSVETAIDHGRARVGVIAEQSRAIRGYHHADWVEAVGLEERTIGKNACQLQRRHTGLHVGTSSGADDLCSTT